VEKTLAIIKPDAVAAKHVGKILDRILEEGFSILSFKHLRLTKSQAEGFYAEHSERPFFGDLVSFMTSGPIVVLALERENAISKWRSVMGVTDSTQAEPHTLRSQFGTDIERNASHGSDSPRSADREVHYFFASFELL